MDAEVAEGINETGLRSVCGVRFFYGGHKVLKVHFLNVGHGDCTIIEHPSGKVTVIDINNGADLDFTTARELAEEFGAGGLKFELNELAGGKRLGVVTEAGYNVSLTNPIDYLKTILNGKPVFRYVQTHPDLDHMRGLSALANEFEILNFWDTANEKEITDFSCESDKEDWTTYQALRKSSTSPKALIFNQGDRQEYFHSYAEGGDDIEILAPTGALTSSANQKENHNNHSYVLRLSYAGVDVLLPGDAEADVWDALVAAYGKRLSATVLKASHHGRDSGFHADAVKLISPEYTIVSVGKKPKTDASNKYRTNSKNVWSTRWKGNIILEVPAVGQAKIVSEYER